jgi:uncharacterized Zn-binding protein involved in type VI secretion
MAGAVRQGDTNSAGGVAKGGANRVKINGRNAMTPGQGVTPHPCCGLPGCAKHCAARTGRGSTRVYVEGRPLVYVGSSDTCGHARATGSKNVNVGI